MKQLTADQMCKTIDDAMGELARLRGALEEIEESFLPSRPALSQHDAASWAEFHIAHLRDIARRALK